MNTSEVLNKAADLIERFGWATGVQGLAVGAGPKCADGAIATVTGRIRQAALSPFGDLYDYGHLVGCPAAEALSSHVGAEKVWEWNDAPKRTATEVVEALRACAVIEAAREEQDAAWETYAELVSS